MQMNEKLVAVNERVEEAQNYRKELKILEIQEAQRIEKMRQKNGQIILEAFRIVIQVYFLTQAHQLELLIVVTIHIT